MIIATSLSPNHVCNGNQVEAVKSWQKYGDCYSFNHPEEAISPVYEIHMIKTRKTLQSILGKKLVNINMFFDFAHSKLKGLLLINSDIILNGLPEFKQDGITVINRYDYTNTFEDAQLFQAGFDVFYIPYQFLTIFPPSPYALGSPWFDYWIPKRAIEKGIPLYFPQGRFAFHKIHATQYNDAEWFRMGEYFKWEFKIDGPVPQIASQTIAEIRSKLICTQ